MPKIVEDKFYTVKQIANIGVLKAPSEYSRRQMLLRYIRDGKIEAQNVGGKLKPRYLVQGKNLIAYKNAQVKPGEIVTK